MKKKNCSYIFIVGMTITILVAFIQVFLHRGNGLQNLYFYDINDTFMDFFKSVIHGRNPYAEQVIYPPLMNVMYLVIRHFIPIELIDQGAFVLRDSQIGMMTYFIYSLVLLYMLAISFFSLYKGTKFEKILVFSCILFSFPFIFCFERGNAILIALVFSMFFFMGYESENKKIRYASYIALAIAAGIKIYPAIYGLLILKRKNKKDVLICLVIGIIVFFAPFLIMKDESRHVSAWINNMLYTNGLYGQLGYGIRHNITAIFDAVGVWLGVNLNFAGRVTLIIVFITSLLLIFVDKKMEKWKQTLLLTLLIIFTPGMSYSYVLIFMIIPLILFFDNNRDNNVNWLNIFRTILFVLIYMPIIVFTNKDLLGMECAYKLYSYTVIENIALIFMFLSILGEELIRICKNDKINMKK